MLAVSDSLIELLSKYLIIFLLNPTGPHKVFSQEKTFFTNVYQNKTKISWDTAVQFLCLTVSKLNIFFSLLQAMYMFYALAIVCDDFFVPSLEKICEVSVRNLYVSLCAVLAAVLLESLNV